MEVTSSGLDKCNRCYWPTIPLPVVKTGFFGSLSGYFGGFFRPAVDEIDVYV